MFNALKLLRIPFSIFLMPIFWFSLVNINDISIELSVDGEVIHAGSSNAILGNPWESVVAAARLSLQYDEPLKQGMILLAGAATPAVYIQVGQTVEANVEGFGKVKLMVT